MIIKNYYIDNKKKISFHYYIYFLIFIILKNFIYYLFHTSFLLNIYNFWLKIKIINYNPKIYNQVTKFNELYFSNFNTNIILVQFSTSKISTSSTLVNFYSIVKYIVMFLKNIMFIFFIFIFYILNYIINCYLFRKHLSLKKMIH